jgi:putative ABC transport system permease protein
MEHEMTTSLRQMFQRIRAVFGHAQLDRDLEEEMAAHLEFAVEENVRRGMSASEARRRALIDFGGATQARELHREARGLPLLETLFQDLRYTLRMLAKSPGFTVVAVLTLALGIGANTAIFGMANTVLFQHLPVRAANRLVVIWINNLKNGWSRVGPAGRDYLEWKEQNRSFEDLFLFEHGTGTVTGAGEPEQVTGLRVTTNFGDFFGIKPFLGRTFRLDEASAKHNLAVLSYSYWQRRYASSPTVLGQGMTLNGEAYTIIGVLPSEFGTVFAADVVVPFDNDRLKRADSDLGVFGRLKPRVSVKQASSDMTVIMEGIGHQRLDRKDFGAVLVPLESARVEYIRPALLLLLVAVGCVLLIACGNVANLLLSRAVGRQREIAARIALGAGRGRLMQQFLVESTIIALIGGAAGLLVALWATYSLMRFVPGRIPVPNAADYVSLPTLHLDVSVLVFTLSISLLTGVLFSLFPVVQSLRVNLNDALKETGRGSLAGPRGNRMRAALVIVESALAFVLVIAAGLMVQSFARLLQTSPGFNADHLLTLRIKLPNDAKDSPYREPWQQAASFQRFVSKVQAVPGVQSAALAEIVPLSQDDMDMGQFMIKEKPLLSTGQHLAADFRDVTPGYFRTMGIPLLQGRVFTEHDDRDNPRVVIIDGTFAYRFFRGQDPVGKHLQVPDATRPEREIVGVVGAVLDTGLDQQPRPTIYFPSQQSPDQTMSLVVRTALPPSSILSAIKNAIWSVDKDQPIFSVRSMDEIISGITSAQRVAFLTLDVFSFLALALAAIGIYGVTSYAVVQRIHEIGVRVALGAQRGDILRLVVLQGMKLAGAGVLIGLLASLGLTRLMASLLFGVSATDPLTFAGVALLLFAVALLACYIPARRASRVHPMVALRHD